MSIVLARRKFVRAWKAWRKARAIRSAMHKAGYGRSGPVKAWYDECTVMMRRTRRALMIELRKPESSLMNVHTPADPITAWTKAYSAMFERQMMAFDRGVQEGTAFIRLGGNGVIEVLNPDEVWGKNEG